MGSAGKQAKFAETFVNNLDFTLRGRRYFSMTVVRDEPFMRYCLKNYRIMRITSEI